MFFLKKGFSFIEVLIVIAVMIVIMLITVGVFSSLNKQKSLESQVSGVMSLINDARLRTISSKEDSEYSVYFEQNRVLLIKGAASSTVSEYNFSNYAEILNISLNGGGSRIVFKKFTGETDNYGKVDLRLKSDVSKVKSVKIGQSGVVSAE